MKNKKLLQYHSICSLIAGVFLILLGITGSILTFNENIDKALFKHYQVNDAPEVLNLDIATAEVQKQYPLWNTRITHFKKGETIVFSVRRPEKRMLVFAHPENGTILGAVDENSHLTKWLLKFHYSLHAGITGRILVLISGILFLVSLITGILLYRKHLLRVLLFQVKFKRKNKRAFYSSLHRYIGVWALLLNLVLAITGVLLAYKVAIAGLSTPSQPDPPLLEISLDNSLKSLEKELPDFHAKYIRLPAKENAPIVINGPFEDDYFFNNIHYNKILVNYKTGHIEEIIKISEKSLSYKADSLVSPLHFGQFAGFIGKLIYAIIGISGPALSITGFIIWYKRKKGKRNKKKSLT